MVYDGINNLNCDLYDLHCSTLFISLIVKFFHNCFLFPCAIIEFYYSFPRFLVSLLALGEK